MGHNGQLKHGMNCSGLIPGREDECTCGLRYRIETQTEQSLKDAWMKRAMEAEKQLLIVEAELEEANRMRIKEKKPCV